MSLVQSPSLVVRRVFATLAIGFGAAGLTVLRGDPKVLAAAGAFGLMWTGWDLLVDHIVTPLLELASHIGHGAAMGGPVNTRPTLDETIRYLHGHIDGDASPAVKLQAGLRLEEIYRLVKKDEAKGRKVLEDMLLRFPDEALLEQRLKVYSTD